MVIRTYFNRNNTLLYNNKTNVGMNPITPLFYGGNDVLSYSRFIFQFDESRIRDFYEDKTFSDLSKLKHTLKMTNTGAFDKSLIGKTTCSGERRSCSFDLLLFKINQEWDEGVGYDLGDCSYDGETSTSFAPSNWFEPRTNEVWENGFGVYTGETSGITQQHFEQGNENLEMDVTDLVNNYITGETNYGLGLAYPYELEQSSTPEKQYVGFFTRHTQTFYEPYIETTYLEVIKDDRNEFFLDKDNKLYLYSNLNGNPTNLDELPTVNIYDNNENLIANIPPSGVTQSSKGVYYININIPTTENTIDCTQFTDVWSNIKINGIDRPDIELDFVVKDSLGYYNIGSDDMLPKQVGVTVTGIMSDERILRGDIRKVIVSTRIPYTINQKQNIDSLKYRLYVKEGRNEYTVIDFQDINMANIYNYFLLDTASLVPGTYYIDIKTESNQEVKTLKNILSFDIVSQSDLRISQ